MIKGLSTSPKPFLKKVLIESTNQPSYDHGGFIDLYVNNGNVDKESPNVLNTLQLTFDIDIKVKYPVEGWITLGEKSAQFVGFQEAIKQVISEHSLTTKRFTNRDEFLNFLKMSEDEKYLKLPSINPTHGWGSNPTQTAFLPSFIKEDLNNYTYYDSQAPSIAYINIPLQFTSTCSYNNSLTSPSFLAYVFYMKSDVSDESVVLPHSLITEVIFDGGKIPSYSGFFTIGDTFRYQGEERTLYETNVSDSSEKDPYVGFPWEDNVATLTDLVNQVNKNFGAPGEVWVGPMHMHKITTYPNPNFGKYRAMGGAIHNSESPHPYLEYNFKPNDKIIDNRILSKIENMFVYNTDKFIDFLATKSDVLFTNGKKKNTIDDLVKNKAVVSEAHYSVRPSIKPVSPDKIWNPATRKWQRIPLSVPIVEDNVHCIFAIDKMRLLKETTKLPGLLDKLAQIDSSFGELFVGQINIFHFEIIRLNKNTGENSTLLVANNDNLYSVDDGKYMFRKKSDLQISNKRSVDLYEFTDGGIDGSGYDSYAYTYKIKLKFKDPLVDYLTQRLNQTRQVLKDLDELLFNIGLKIYDNSKKKFVDVFDPYQQQLHPVFVNQLLTNDEKPQLPLTFGFVDEIPITFNEAFPLNEDLSGTFNTIENLNYLLVFLNDYEDLEPVENYSMGFVGMLKIRDLIQTLRNSLKLSSTNPKLIGQVRDLIFMIETRLTNALKLYTNENITKQFTGFTYTDYLKSAGNVINSGDYVIDFSYVFDEDINMSQTKNYFNWISSASNILPNRSLKVISNEDYINLVQNQKIVLSSTGKKDVTDAYYSYSFLPLRGSELSLFNDMASHNNNTLTEWDQEYFQTIRKRLFDRITSNKEPILIPEILSFFGIRFKSDNNIDFVFDDLALEEGSLGAGWKDQWGEDYVEDVFEFIFTGGGSAGNDPDTAWQGGSSKNYPHILARSLINILNTDLQEKNIDLGYLHDVYNQESALQPVPEADFSNKNIPFIINLLATSNVSQMTKEAQAELIQSVAEGGMSADAAKDKLSWLDPALRDWIFYPDGALKYFHYSIYLMLLGLFGRVYYLQSFNQGSKNEKLTPTSYADRNLVNSWNWVPISKQVLDNLPAGRELLCKVQLYEDFTWLDGNFVDLFKKYYKYNEHFIIRAGLPALSDRIPPERIRKNIIDVDMNRMEKERREIISDRAAKDRGPTPEDRNRARAAARNAPNVEEVERAEHLAAQTYTSTADYGAVIQTVDSQVLHERSPPHRKR